MSNAEIRSTHHQFLNRNVLKDRKRRSWIVAALALTLLLLPVLLSPTHPIAVYGYLAAMYVPAMNRPVYAYEADGLNAFLVSPSQVERYRRDLLADMADECSGRMFAIVKGFDNRLAQVPIRTWNSFVPSATPDMLKSLLDRKELPFLGDEVALWLENTPILAVGHYHAFGGPPSSGDRLAQGLSDLPEVVISNGLIPSVYLRGALVPYGADLTVQPDLYRSLRTLESSIMMDVGEAIEYPAVPSDALRSFLAYLRDRDGINTDQRQDVAEAILRLCLDFEQDYRFHFGHGYSLGRYPMHPDKENMAQKLNTLKGWASVYRVMP